MDQYRATQFEVDNGAGVGLDIRIDPESVMDGELSFEVEQDTDKIFVSIACLHNLIAAAQELHKAHFGFYWEPKP
jgi:hypothetical protein